MSLSALNFPGARSAYCAWTSGSRFWLFGGNNGSYFNDLWSYNPFSKTYSLGPDTAVNYLIATRKDG